MHGQSSSRKTPTNAIETGIIIALLFLLFGLFIDAIPTIIILGTVLTPDASGADIHPVVFAIIGIISSAFGLVTPPYGLCLLISSVIVDLNVVQVLRDVVTTLIPMLVILMLVIVSPEIALWLPCKFMPGIFDLGGGGLSLRHVQALVLL